MLYPRVIATCDVLYFEIKDLRKFEIFLISGKVTLSIKVSFKRGKNRYTERI